MKLYAAVIAGSAAAAAGLGPTGGRGRPVQQLDHAPEEVRGLLRHSLGAGPVSLTSLRLRSEVGSGWSDWMLWGGIGLVVILAAAVATFFLTRRKENPESKAMEEQGAEPAAASEPLAPVEASAQVMEDVNFERFLKLIAKRGAQQVGPKLAKANNVRCVLENRVRTFKNKAARFLFDEVLGTVGTILREMQAEEVMLLLDPAASAAANVPPSSILLAGLLSPVVLTVSLIIHLSQVFMVLVPVLCMCIWAIYVDWNTLSTCAVPTIWYWIYGQALMALVLAVAHLVTTVHIQAGKGSIQEKVEGMRERIREAVSDGELSLDEMRELFIIVSILLEHSLIVEDELRRSIWRTIIGYGTILWICMTAWTFVLVLGWTFVPGMVAFHAAAATVAGGDFCGAWASVFTARLSCVLSLLFLLFNLLSVVQFVSDQLVVSDSYSAAVLSSAKKFDDSMLGIPVVQTFVKAFLLRGTADSLKTQIAVSRETGAKLERQKEELQDQIAALGSRIEACKAEATALKREAGIVDEDDKTMGAAASELAEEAAAQAKALEKATKQEIDQLYQRIVEAASQLRESGALADALAQAQHSAEAGVAAAQHSMDAAAQQAQQAAQDAAQQAQAASRGLSGRFS